MLKSLALAAGMTLAFAAGGPAMADSGQTKQKGAAAQESSDFSAQRRHRHYGGHRHYGHRHYGHRHYGYRHYGYRPYYRSYGAYGYPYGYYRPYYRPAPYVSFGFPGVGVGFW